MYNGLDAKSAQTVHSKLQKSLEYFYFLFFLHCSKSCDPGVLSFRNAQPLI